MLRKDMMGQQTRNAKLQEKTKRNSNLGTELSKNYGGEDLLTNPWLIEKVYAEGGRERERVGKSTSCERMRSINGAINVNINFKSKVKTGGPPSDTDFKKRLFVES